MEDSVKISADAIQWIKSHSKEIIEQFTGKYTGAEKTGISIFMAGSPGAGKTEFSKNLLQIFGKENHSMCV